MTAEKPALSNSAFQMWRTVIALAHADGHVSAEEEGYLSKVLTALGERHHITAAQQDLLNADIEIPKKVEELFPLIDSPEDRSQALYFAGLVAAADGEVCAGEKAILTHLHATQMAGINMDSLRADVGHMLAQEALQREDKIADMRREMRKKNILFNAVDRLLMRLGIDILN